MEKTTAQSQCDVTVTEIHVTDKFSDMMKAALPVAIAVLEKRKKDLEIWGGKEIRDFQTIMGFYGHEKIIHDYVICDKLSGGHVLKDDYSFGFYEKVS